MKNEKLELNNPKKMEKLGYKIGKKILKTR